MKPWHKLLISSFLVFWGTVRSNPLISDNAQAEVRSDSDAFNYLSGRNWIPAGQASELVNLRDLLSSFQVYTGLPVTGILDEATKAKMNSPQCGNPDFGEGGSPVSFTLKKRYTHSVSRWPTEITWYLQNGTPDLDKKIVRWNMWRAFQYWADVIPLTFRQVFTTNADIIVQFAVGHHGDGNSFDGPGLVLAHAFYPGSGLGGSGTNLLQVAVHEIGHSLGLGHSSDNSAIMAPYYTYRENFALGTDDINGIQAWYGEKRHGCPNPGEPHHLVETVVRSDLRPLNDHGMIPEGDIIISRCKDPRRQKMRGNSIRFCTRGKLRGDPAECEFTNVVFSFGNTVSQDVSVHGSITVYPRYPSRVPITINCFLKGSRGRLDMYYDGRGMVQLDSGYNRVSHRISSSSDSGRYRCYSTEGTHSIYVQYM